MDQLLRETLAETGVASDHGCRVQCVTQEAIPFDAEMEDMTSSLAMISARQSNESVRSDRIGMLKGDSDHGGVSYVVSWTTCFPNARTIDIPSATHRHITYNCPGRRTGTGRR